MKNRSSIIQVQRIQDAISNLLEAIGEDPRRPGLQQTPERVARMCQELFSGIGLDPEHAIDAVFEAESQDPVFDRCVGVRCPSWYSYRSIADVQRVDLGIAFPLKSVNVDLSGRYFEADGDVDVYRNWMVQLGIVWNF